MFGRPGHGILAGFFYAPKKLVEGFDRRRTFGVFNAGVAIYRDRRTVLQRLLKG